MTEESKTKDDDMTPEQRLAWLRERGIQISTAEERKVAQTVESMKYADSLPREAFTYILIPADTSKPLQERSLQPPTNQPGDLLLEELKPEFAKGGKNVDVSLLQQQATQTLAGSADVPSVSSETLQQVAAQANIETFTVVHGTPSNKFTEVLIYLDEVGLLKRLPLNTRASQYAQVAGFDPPPQFYGDVFMGRLQRKPVMRNVSFKLGEDTAMDAPWLKSATMENLNHQMEVNQLSGRHGEVQPKVDGDGASKQEEGFSWTQTEEEMEVHVPIDDSIKSKDIKVDFRPQTLKVSVSGAEVVALPLFERVDVDGCTWTIDTDPTRKLVISMEKMEGALWPRIKD